MDFEISSWEPIHPLLELGFGKEFSWKKISLTGNYKKIFPMNDCKSLNFWS